MEINKINVYGIALTLVFIFGILGIFTIGFINGWAIGLIVGIIIGLLVSILIVLQIILNILISNSQTKK